MPLKDPLLGNIQLPYNDPYVVIKLFMCGRIKITAWFYFLYTSLFYFFSEDFSEFVSTYLIFVFSEL